MTTYIFGHQNPDTDAISSAIIMADFEQQHGNKEAKAFRIGELGPETQYALDYFNVEVPEFLTDDLTGQDVILVDHNEFQQSAHNIEKANIRHVIDHHRIANFETAVRFITVRSLWAVQQRFCTKCIMSATMKFVLRLRV